MSPLIIMSHSNESLCFCMCITRSAQSWPSVVRGVAVVMGCGEWDWPGFPRGSISSICGVQKRDSRQQNPLTGSQDCLHSREHEFWRHRKKSTQVKS